MTTFERPMSLTRKVREHIRELIVSGRYPLGSMLSERQIAEELGVSKTPVRESLVQLQLEGLVTIAPQRGAVVFTLTEEEVLEISDFRATVEWSAVEMAMNRNYDAYLEELDGIIEAMGRARANEDLREYMALDNAFHSACFNHCGNRYLKEGYDRYAGKIAALRVHLVVRPEHTLRSYNEHTAMRDCVRAGDRYGFKAILEKHTIGRASEFIREEAKSLDKSAAARNAV